MARALTGGAPVIKHDQAAVRWDKCKGAELVTLTDRSRKLVQRIWMKRSGPGRWRVLQSTVRDGKGKMLVRLRFERFRRVGGRQLPRVIKFEQPRRKADVIIRYAKQEINVSLPDEAFKLTSPPGLPEQILTCP